jgi:hypothetical protein
MEHIEIEAKPKSRKKVKPTPDALRIKFLEDMVDTNRTEAEGWRLVASEQKVKITALEAQIVSLQESLNGVVISIEAIRL